LGKEGHTIVLLTHIGVDVSDLMTLPEVADYLRVPRKSLYLWRHKHVGPPAARVGRHLRYRREDVDQWLFEQRDANESGGGTAA
jgi:excisionase family DNA binding protein